MNKQIYKFLDECVGEGAVAEYQQTPLRTWSENYNLVSNNGTMIFWFQIRSDEIKIYRSESLCRKIEGYFGIDKNDSWKYIRDWFGKKYEMKTLSDIMKFIPQNQ